MCIRDSRKTAAGRAGHWKDEQTDFRCLAEVSAETAPVSYTHLDVYKRQAGAESGAWRDRYAGCCAKQGI